MRVRVFPTITLLALLAFAAPISASLAQLADDDSGRLPLQLEAPKIDPALLAAPMDLLPAVAAQLRVLIELHAPPSARVYADSLKRGDKAQATADAKSATGRYRPCAAGARA